MAPSVLGFIWSLWYAWWCQCKAAVTTKTIMFVGSYCKASYRHYGQPTQMMVLVSEGSLHYLGNVRYIALPRCVGLLNLILFFTCYEILWRKCGSSLRLREPSGLLGG